MLGEVVSSPRCPALRKLTVRDAYGLANLTIQSDSLIEMELENLWRYGDIGLGNFRIHSESLSRLSLINLQGLQELSVMAPALERLKVCSCFREGFSHNSPVANIYLCPATVVPHLDGCL